jgi:hypothetical protein
MLVRFDVELGLTMLSHKDASGEVIRAVLGLMHQNCVLLVLSRRMLQSREVVTRSIVVFLRSLLRKIGGLSS